MWEAMGAPVRCLDEFDVFMDSVNRDVSMDMLIRFARDSVGKQFILITPQNMSKINVHDEDITIVRYVKFFNVLRTQMFLFFSLFDPDC